MSNNSDNHSYFASEVLLPKQQLRQFNHLRFISLAYFNLIAGKFSYINNGSIKNKILAFNSH